MADADSSFWTPARIGAVIGVILLVVMTAGCTSSGPNTFDRGDLKNIAGEKLDYVSIKAKFYDETGALVGNGVDFVQNLGAGETWRFDIMYSGYAHRVTLDEVVAY